MAGQLGVPALDARLGPVAAGGSVLLLQDEVVEALPFLLQACGHQLGAGAPVVYLVNQRPPSRLRQALRQAGQPHDGAGGLHIMDAYSARHGTVDPGAAYIAHPEDLEQVAEVLQERVSSLADPVVIIEGLDTLVSQASNARHAKGLLDACKGAALCLATAALWNVAESEEAWRSRFDAEVRLRGVEERIVLNQAMEVARTPWNDDPGPPILYKVAQPGGILAHVPKLVIIGPHDSGKTTFVHSLAGGAVSVERLGTTVALDRATVQVDGASVEVFGTPGQVRFDALMPMLTKQATAAILVVDATRPELFSRASDILSKVWRQGLNTLVALNKQDMAGAVREDDLDGRLKLPPGVAVIGCTATDPASAKAVLRALVQRVLGVPA